MSLAHAHRSFAGLLVAPLALFAAGEELKFVPKEGLTVALVIEQTAEANVVSESWVSLYEGEPIEGEEHTGEGGSNWSFDLSITVLDTYDAVADGRVTGLTRTFEEIGGTSQSTVVSDEGEEESEATLTSPLVGRTVEFEWDADEAEYLASFDEDGDDGEVDSILLEDVRVDAFGAWFLPESGTELEEGDEWDAGVGAWNDFLEVGGDFWIDVEEADPPSESVAAANREQAAQMRSSAEGDVTCTFEGVREVDGVEMAVISISVDVTSSSEVESDGGYGDEGVTVLEAIEMTVSGEGICLWNVEANRAHSIRLEVDLEDSTVTVDTIEDVDADETYGTKWTVVTETTTTVEYRFEER